MGGRAGLSHDEAWRESFAPPPSSWVERPEAQALDALRAGRNLHIILGEPGAGKSRLLAHWAEEARPAAPGYGTLVPLLLPLRRLHDLPDLLDPALKGAALADRLWALGDPGIPGDGRSFRPLWLLDGLDELPESQPLADWLRRFRTLPGTMVATCRTAVWQAGVSDLAGQAPERVEALMPLRPGVERAAFLAPALGQARASVVVAALDHHAALAPLAGNPLLLTLAAELWLEGPGRLPASRTEFYRRVVESYWDRRVKGSARDRTRARDRVLECLATALGLAAEGGKGLLEDALDQAGVHNPDALMAALRASGLVVVDDRRGTVSFLHLTFQEYFLAAALARDGAVAAVQARWADPRQEEVLALILARLTADGRAAEAAQALAWLGEWSQSLAAEPSESHRLGRSPLRTALHLVARAGLDAAALGGTWALLEGAVAPGSARALAAARDRLMPLELLERLAGDADPVVRWVVASNPATPAAALERLASDLAEEWPAPQDERTVEALERAIVITGGGVRAAAARNPFTPAAALERLAGDTDWVVRSKAAQNPSTPAAVLERLASDAAGSVGRSVAGNPSTPAAALERLASDPDWMVRREVALNPSTPPATLERLADDANEVVREGAAWKLYIQKGVQEHLATDPNRKVPSSALDDLMTGQRWAAMITPNIQLESLPNQPDRDGTQGDNESTH